MYITRLSSAAIKPKPVASNIVASNILKCFGNLKAEKGREEPEERMEARTGVEPVMEVLQTSALPLGYRAS
jgi:hypothetical protein